MYLSVLRVLLFVLVTVCAPSVLKAEQVVLKINVLLGDGFEDPAVDPLEIQKIFSDGFARQNDTVWDTNVLLENLERPAELYFADVFVYKYPNTYPAMTLTVRRGEKVYVFINEHKMVFGTPKTVFNHLARDIAQKIPLHFYETVQYHPTTGKIFKEPGDGIEGRRRGLSNTVTKDYRSSYQVEWGMENDTSQSTYPFSDSFADFFPYCLDLKGFRGKLTEKEFQIMIQITDLGQVITLDFELPVKLKAKQMDQLRNAVSALPLMVMRDWKPKTGSIRVRVL